MDVITDKDHARRLADLLWFLERWEKRPAYLTPMAYEWCSAISEMAIKLGEGRAYTSRRPYLAAKQWFRSNCYLIHSDATYRTCGCPIDLHLNDYMDLLFTTLEVGFRPAGSGHDQRFLSLNHTPHHNQMFEAAFSSDDDEVIADAMRAWSAGGCPPTGSCVRYFTRRMGEATPFSPRLREVAISAIERTWPSELATSGSETVRLLHRLDVNVGDTEGGHGWVELLVGVIRSPVGFKNLSPCYWRLLGKLISVNSRVWSLASRDVEVMRSLEEAEDWEKLEVWMAVMWKAPIFPKFKSVEGIEEVTLKLALRRPSALQRFEDLCKRDAPHSQPKLKLRGICDRARAEQLPLEASPQP